MMAFSACCTTLRRVPSPNLVVIDELLPSEIRTCDRWMLKCTGCVQLGPRPPNRGKGLFDRFWPNSPPAAWPPTASNPPRPPAPPTRLSKGLPPLLAWLVPPVPAPVPGRPPVPATWPPRPPAPSTDNPGSNRRSEQARPIATINEASDETRMTAGRRMISAARRPSWRDPLSALLPHESVHPERWRCKRARTRDPGPHRHDARTGNDETRRNPRYRDDCGRCRGRCHTRGSLRRTRHARAEGHQPDAQSPRSARCRDSAG